MRCLTAPPSCSTCPRLNIKDHIEGEAGHNRALLPVLTDQPCVQKRRRIARCFRTWLTQFDVPPAFRHPVRHRFITGLVPEGRPGCVIDALRHPGSGPCAGNRHGHLRSWRAASRCAACACAHAAPLPVFRPRVDRTGRWAVFLRWTVQQSPSDPGRCQHPSGSYARENLMNFD